MPAPIVLMLGGAAFRVVSKKVIDLLVKRGAKRLSKTQIDKLAKPPKNVTVNNVSNVLKQVRPLSKPKVSQGGPPPAARPNTAPAAPRTAPKPPATSKPSNRPNVPSATTRPKPGTNVSKPKAPRSSSNSSGPSRPMKDITPNKNAPARPSGSRIVGINPKAMRAPSTKLGALDTAAPEVVVTPSDDKKPEAKKPAAKKPPLKKTTKKQGEANKKAAETKKNAPTKTAPKKSPRPKKRPAAGPVTNESFGKAFARNRKSGNATFTWKDKKYTTRYKEESIAQHKKKFGVEGKY